MTVPVAPETLAAIPEAQRRRRGTRANLYGGVAEERVIQAYQRQGKRIIHHRWRSTAGEIDLIVRDGETVVFVEVKAAPTHDAAMARLRPAQMQRIYRSAEAYLRHEPKGQLTDVRFDLALYDHNGVVQIIENAFGHF